MAGLNPDLWAIGHPPPPLVPSSSRTAPSSPTTPSLSILRDWLIAWEDAGRPAPETYTPTLASHDEPGMNGWNLRLTR